MEGFASGMFAGQAGISFPDFRLIPGAGRKERIFQYVAIQKAQL